MTTYNVFPETAVPATHLMPSQATSGTSVVFTGNTPYDFEKSAAIAAGLVVGNTYTVDTAFVGFGNPTISLREKNTIPTDLSGNGEKRPVFNMYMFTLAA